MNARRFRCRLGALAAILLLTALAGGAEATAGVAAPVELDDTIVYWAVRDDSAAALADAERVREILAACRERLRDPEDLVLEETDSTAVIRLDSLVVLVVRPENRVDESLSPLANALRIRSQLVRPLVEGRTLGEEALLLRLFLGIVFPVLLLVILRMTRLNLRRWERNWRSSLRKWLQDTAAKRRVELSNDRIRGVVRTLTAVERLFTYGTVVVLISFLWFAIFPDTRPLAATLLNRILSPALELLGETARGLMILLYSLAILLAAYGANRWLARRWRQRKPAELLGDPAVHIPLRIGVWIAAIFLVLFPYHGAPRLFATGLLLLVVLIALIALRPVTEEIASGFYINTVHALRAGDRLTIDEKTYDVIDLGLAHLRVRDESSERWIPYSRILKASIAVKRGPEAKA